MNDSQKAIRFKATVSMYFVNNGIGGMSYRL